MTPNELIEKLEDLATELDDGTHGQNPPGAHIADLLEQMITAYREANDGE